MDSLNVDPLIIIGIASVVMALVILFGVTRIMRGRRYHMADLRELPSPPRDKTGGGPTMQA
jgi:hypothetical protein